MESEIATAPVDGEQEVDGEPPAKAARTAQPDGARSPQKGWVVDGFTWTYCTNHGMLRASVAKIFLARDEHGKPQGVQWWHKNGPPTCFHGSWWHSLDGTLVINFHCLGPAYEGKPTRLRTTLLRRQTLDAYEGLDEERHKIRLVKYCSWVVQNPRREGLCL